MVDWPQPVSRKTNEDDVKKSFLSDPGSISRGSLKDFSRQMQVFRAKRVQP